MLKLAAGTLRRNRREVIIDLDATADPVHGRQEGRFFHGCHDCYCHLPLFAFIGETVAWAQLRRADIDASEGIVPLLEKLVPVIRRRRPKTRILIRADSGFCREEIMAWCETHHIGHILRLARNPRLPAN
ncbi:MAG: transposase [Opitutaceae bacterium]|nr:transposase [Opitutaceae bacterium]